jgi:signal transduction histidine kinase
MDKSKIGRQKGERGKASAELAALLSERREEIATAWAEMVRALPGSSYADLSAEDMRSLTRRGVGAMVESLESGSRASLEGYLADICPATSEAIPEACAVTEALLLCKHAALPIIREALSSDFGKAWALVSELDSLLRCMVVRLTSLCTTEMAQQLAGERAQVAMLLDMAQTVSSTLELDEVVSRASEQIAAALGADGCTFHLVDEEHRSAVSLYRPSDWSSRVSRSYDSLASHFHEVLTTRQPVTSYDVQSDPRFPQDTARELEARSTVGLPLMVKGKVIAVAWAYTVHEHRRFTDDEIVLAQGMGNMLGLVVQNAQLYERSKLLAKMEERARLSREIHDGIAQTLGALQLKASQLEESLFGGGGDQSRAYLSELQDMISRAYRDLRKAMFELRAVVEPGTALAPALQEYLAHYRADYGLDVGLEVSEGDPVILEEETQAQAMRVVQEALSNVRRHAGTGRATVSIQREGDRLRICVTDEGCGFDLGSAEEYADGLHLGLHIMRERAESVGGSLTVESSPGRGTKAVLELRGLRKGGLP